MDSTGFAVPARLEAPLSASGVEAGIAAVQETVNRLVRDARLLLNARRYATAATLAAMALTEYSRIAGLLELAAARTDDRVKAAWRHFREADYDLPLAGLLPPEKAGATRDVNYLVEMLRLVGSRAEYFDPGVWITGDKLVHRALAEELIKTAEMISKHGLDQQSIERWVAAISSLPEDATPEQHLQAFRDVLEAPELPVLPGRPSAKQPKVKRRTTEGRRRQN